MGRLKIKYLLLFITFSWLSCVHDPELAGLVDSSYPREVGNIIISKCAISGCHNSLSYVNSANLDMSTWDNLFKGSGLTGSTVIPYRPDFSSLCYFSNVDSSLGITSQPTMPYNLPTLTKDEYLILKNWIANGAPNSSGGIKFTDNPSRKKFYVTNRMCDVVTSIDETSLLQMNYINVGGTDNAQYPYCIKVSPDRKYYYVSFFTQTGIVQKYNADNDKLVGNINIGSGAWTSFAITKDSKYGYFADNSSPGKIVYVDLDNMSVLATYTFGGHFNYISGLAINDKLKKIYAGTASGNFIYNIDISNPLSPTIHEMPIDGTSTVQYASSLNPIELVADTDNNTCFIACQQSNEIRIVDMQEDTVIAAIQLGQSPASMGYSGAAKKLFISCPDDMNSFTNNRGSVMVADLLTNKIVKKINTGYQPYGIAVDAADNIVGIVNANISGPGSHHASGCGKKNGYISFIDVNTLALVPGKQLIVAVFPYGIAYR